MLVVADVASALSGMHNGNRYQPIHETLRQYTWCANKYSDSTRKRIVHTL